MRAFNLGWKRKYSYRTGVCYCTVCPMIINKQSDYFPKRFKIRLAIPPAPPLPQSPVKPLRSTDSSTLSRFASL